MDGGHSPEVSGAAGSRGGDQAVEQTADRAADQSTDQTADQGTDQTANREPDQTADQADATAAFVAALRVAQTALRAVPGKLEGARVHDFAFGKMFEATEVRDAYHNRLPETEKDIVEACEVIEHFIAGLSGGHSIGPRTDGLGGPDGLDAPDSAPSRTAGRTPDTFPWLRTIPSQDGSRES